MMKRGFFFTLDAFLGAVMLIGGLILVLQVVDYDTDITQLETASEDTVVLLDAITMKEVQHPWVQTRVVNGSIDENATLLEQIGVFWALGDLDDAETLAAIALDDLFPDEGVRLVIEDTVIYERNGTKGGNDVLVASQMISGIAEGEAISGSSASAFLRKVRDRRTSVFTIFGGFVGQGNISMRFVDLPADANVSNMTLELASASNFSIAFNGVPCGSTYNVTNTTGAPDKWDITTCKDSLLLGSTNIFELTYETTLNDSYLMGGFLQIKYKTDTLQDNTSTGFLQYRFPGIDGTVNLFDGFFIPGTLQKMDIYLHYNASNSTYVEIGDKEVLFDVGNDIEKVVILNDSWLRDPLGGKLDYDFLSNKTIPIRFQGFESTSVEVLAKNADVVLITDFSGSMKKAVEDWSQGNAAGDCDDAFESNDIRRTKVAECVDLIFLEELFNVTGNRLWPVFLHSDEVKWYNNPTDKDGLEGYIESYSQGKDKTCYACALNQAYEIFESFSNDSRAKFIVFMTDGVPTHCAADGCTGNSTVYGSQQCDGLCDFQGACSGADIGGLCSACITNNGGQQNAYHAANRSINEFNVTVFTVGFGPVGDCSMATETLQELADMGNGTYQNSTNTSQLRDIYKNISQEILARSELQSQKALISGDLSRSKLFDDSYINITYDLAEQFEVKQNMLTVNLLTDQACNPIVPLYEEQTIIDAQAISYSGIHWTDYVAVNGEEVYNLSDFLKEYVLLGDPTVVHTPVHNFTVGNNVITIETGDAPQNRTGCSPNNTAIYSVSINLSTERSEVVPYADGCTWFVEFEDGTYDNMTIPPVYSGNNTCVYNSSQITYDDQDAYQLGTYQILVRLDFNKDGTLSVNLNEEDLEIVVTTISQVPYMWGPTKAQIEVTR